MQCCLQCGMTRAAPTGWWSATPSEGVLDAADALRLRGSVMIVCGERHSSVAPVEERALRTELAGFVTLADRLEIELIAGRYPDEVSGEVRGILLRQDVGV